MPRTAQTIMTSIMDGGEVVTRLLERLDGHGTGEDQVDHDDGDPSVGVETQRGGHADGEHGNDHDDGDDELGDALEVELVAGPAEGDGTNVKRIEMVPVEAAA